MNISKTPTVRFIKEKMAHINVLEHRLIESGNSNRQLQHELKIMTVERNHWKERALRAEQI